MFRTTKALGKLIILENLSIRDALKKLDEGGHGIIQIVDDNKILKGIFTDSDFRKIVLKKIDLDTSITKVMNKNPIVINKKSANKEEIQALMQTNAIWQLPIVDNGKVVDLVVESDLFDLGKTHHNDIIESPIPVLIMAGGKGTRLDPITRIIPKPLVPIGEKTIIEIIMNKFSENGINEFIISINYKGSLIKTFIKESVTNYNIKFLEEESYLGTIGSLKLLENKLDTPIFVANCDILLDISFKDLLTFHYNNKFDMTLVGSMLHHALPYGVCDVLESGELISIKEKPEMDYLINAGMYIINPDCLRYIPKNDFFDATDLIKSLKDNGKNVGVYPIRDSVLLDIGQLEEYKKIIMSI